MLLHIARDQFDRILRKSRLPGSRISDTPASTRAAWRTSRLNDEQLFVSGDGFSAIAINELAREFFTQVNGLLAALSERGVQPFSAEHEQQLLAQVEELRGLARHLQFPRDEFQSVNGTRFEVIARDATGITFLRRAS